MFSRFVGTKKPVEVKEQAPIDTTRLSNHVDALNKREAEVTQKLQDIDSQLAAYSFVFLGYS